MRLSFSNYAIAYLRDDLGVLSTCLRASITPEVVIIDSENQTVFRGSIDDRFDSPDHYTDALEASGRWPWSGVGELRPGREYLSQALNELLTLRRVSQPVAPLIGCALCRN